MKEKNKSFPVQKYHKKNEQQIAVKSNHAQVGEGERKTKERRGNIIIAINIFTDGKSGKGYMFDDFECWRVVKRGKWRKIHKKKFSSARQHRLRLVKSVLMMATCKLSYVDVKTVICIERPVDKDKRRCRLRWRWWRNNNRQETCRIAVIFLIKNEHIQSLMILCTFLMTFPVPFLFVVLKRKYDSTRQICMMYGILYVLSTCSCASNVRWCMLALLCLPSFLVLFGEDVKGNEDRELFRIFNNKVKRKNECSQGRTYALFILI